MLTLYLTILGLACLLGIHRFVMVISYLRYRNAPPGSGPCHRANITIQLPIFNERNVVEQLLNSICALQWSHGTIEIQVLDDSTDDTQEILQQLVSHYQAQGIQIHYLHRKKRTGYKAGALEEGLKTAKGEFLAIFDADFTPQPDFLESAMGHFISDRVGMVQARWEHQNREQNLLTALSSIYLDGHFVIEHTTRNRSGRFFNFNGTAGIWRRRCIEDAGGWQHDTITEDLDLSYRAQLRGWQFIYLRDVTAPAEIPDHMSAFAAQQFRWAKGTTQTAIKLGSSIWKAPISFWTKLEASIHLFGNIGYLLILCLTILMPHSAPLRFEKYQGHFLLDTLDISLFLFSTAGVLLFYGLSQKEIGALRSIKKLFLIPLTIGLGIGLSFQQTRAVFQGIRNADQVFVRTPKQGRQRIKQYTLSDSPKGWVELILGLYCLISMLSLLLQGIVYPLPFLALFSFGYCYVGFGLLAPQRHQAQALSSEFTPEIRQPSK